MAGVKGKSGRKNHSTGEKAGRKIGTAEKTKKLFGYRYTEEEYNSMISIIEELEADGMSVSEIIYKAIIKYKNP